ncbi:MAG: HD domain-containing phosphohydrolase [Thiobacillaceae bacterium]
MPTDTLPTILTVDDSPENLAILNAVLQPGYRVLAAKSGERALRIASGPGTPDLILLDVMMPGMDGYQVFEKLRANPATRHIPIIFITSMSGEESELRALELGAADYISKPIAPPVVLARVRTQLELKRARDLMANQNTFLDAEVKRRTAESDLIQMVGIRALAHLAEIRDPETGNHILRTQRYIRELAFRVREHPRFRAILSDRYIDLLTRSAPLHDIGKVAIPDAILQKPGPLTAAEWEIMKTHSQKGAEAIELAERDVEQPVAFLDLAKEIAHWHHEQWDGSGYPDGRAGEDIPLSARLMAVADVFDALISPRVYKLPIPQDTARDLIAAGRGAQFDPDITDSFLASFDAFAAIARQHGDPG